MQFQENQANSSLCKEWKAVSLALQGSSLQRGSTGYSQRAGGLFPVILETVLLGAVREKLKKCCQVPGAQPTRLFLLFLCHLVAALGHCRPTSRSFIPSISLWVPLSQAHCWVLLLHYAWSPQHCKVGISPLIKWDTQGLQKSPVVGCRGSPEKVIPKSTLIPASPLLKSQRSQGYRQFQFLHESCMLQAVPGWLLSCSMGCTLTCTPSCLQPHNTALNTGNTT